MRTLLFAFVATAFSLLAGFSAAAKAPEELVNILGGTDSHYDISHGSTLPLITRPWGFNSFAPQTDDDPTWPGWWFHPSDRRFFGLRLTHQPSPWIRDYGNMLFKAYIPSGSDAGKDKFSGYSPTKSVFSPYYFQTDLLAYCTSTECTRIELTPTSHGAIMRTTFPTYEPKTQTGDDFPQSRRISIVLNGNGDQSSIGTSDDGSVMISGFTKANNGGVGSSDSFAHYFVAVIYAGENGDKPVVAQKSFADASSAWVDFDAEDSSHKQLTVRIGTSFISLEQAKLNLQQEVAVGINFDQAMAAAKQEWHDTLGRADLQEQSAGFSQQEHNAQLVTFYSSLYRASIFPRQLSEVAADGSLVHWSPYLTGDNHVGTGEFSTDSGFWDAWNTVYPLLSLVNRPQLGTTIQGWVNSYKEGGWLPKWASPGYRGSMVGTMGDVSLADAIVKNIPGFDVATAYESIRKDAFEVPPEGVDGVGRVCLSSYLEYGYVPQGAPATTGGLCDQIVSRTLNYLQSDWAIAQAAKKLGHSDDATTLLNRAANFSATFDADSGFFRSRYITNEKWTQPFDEFAWGGDYTEGGPWQFRFYLPYDPEGLSATYKASGRDICDELQNAQTMEKSVFHIGAYGSEIHEQTEMPDHCWGQYAHNNQPVHHMLYMFLGASTAGSSAKDINQCAARGQYWIRKTVTDLYKPTSDMFPGDEDNGEMAAWYVLSTVGLYNLSPGSEDFVLGSPLFSKVVIDISDITTASKRIPSVNNAEKKTLTVEAVNNSKDNVYVQSVAWNGVSLAAGTRTISYSQLSQGGTLTFYMGASPAQK